MFSDDFIDLTGKMLSFDPKKRLDIKGLLSHPWMQGPMPKKETVAAEFAARKALIAKKHLQQKQVFCQANLQPEEEVPSGPSPMEIEAGPQLV